MGTPRSVKRQAEKAKKIQDEIAKRKQGETNDPQEPTDPSQPNAAPASESNAPPATEGARPVETPPPTAPAEEGNWRNRYEGMKKAYDREVPQLRRQLEEADKEIATNRRMMEELQAQIAPTSGDAPAASGHSVLSAEELEEYGPELVALVEKLAEHKAKEATSQANDRLESMEAKTRAAEAQRFFVSLTRQVEDWEAINANPEFHNYLSEVVPGTGRERQVFLAEAHASGDADRVAGFFNGFKTQQGVPSKRDGYQPPPDTVQPTTSNAGNPERDEGRAWSRQEIADFYNAKTMGKFRGREDEAARIEQQINAAVRERRVR